VLAATAAGTAVLVGVMSFSFSSYLASYLREHKPLRYLVNPMNFIWGSIAYGAGEHRAARPFEYREGSVLRIAAAHGSKPLLVFVVLGETARAANFELGGYDRPTNPELSKIEDLVYFSDVSSCGTSTATSLPCMFSHVGRKQFDVDVAPSQSNLLDAAARGGIDVEWRDNNSGCKHICDRVREIDFRVPPYNDGCTGEECFDEVMTKGLAERLQAGAKDALVVFHQAGSHGPAYFERYPPAFAKFTPDCRTKELPQCQRDTIVNAYDNSILYTDHVVASQIALLESLQDRYDSLLIYVSDHGESLGENGVYLHAAPYFVAPTEQTHVPLLVWMSDGYRQRAQTDVACVRGRAVQPASHDDLYHTVLGALGLRNDAYRAELDLLAGCRKGW
jgi:lipid A ethanolaminephosphotransferase